jgi:hypothetical protein
VIDRPRFADYERLVDWVQDAHPEYRRGQTAYNVAAIFFPEQLALLEREQPDIDMVFYRDGILPAFLREFEKVVREPCIDPLELTIEFLPWDEQAAHEGPAGVRMTHKPTGMVTQCTAFRTLRKNQTECLYQLKQRLKEVA